MTLRFRRDSTAPAGVWRRILYASELGETRSHLAAFHRVAITLNAKGYQTVFAARNVTEVTAIVGRDGFRVLPAPPPPRVIRAIAGLMPVSYPEVLARVGFMDEAALSAMVRAWSDLFSMVQPDLLVSNHSPAALLAARAGGIPHILFGAPFWAPPRRTPMPTFWSGIKVRGERLAQTEHAVLRVINKTLTDLKATPLGTFAELFGLVRDSFLCSLPELDPYPSRTGGRYCGPSLPDESGVALRWPETSGKRVLVNIDQRHPEATTLLEGFQTLQASVLLCGPRGQWKAHEKYVSVGQSAQLSSAAGQCDLAICNGDLPAVSTFLMAGVPLLLLPLRPEHRAVATRVTTLGTGIAAGWSVTDGHVVTVHGAKYPDYAALLAAILSDTAIKEKVKHFSLASSNTAYTADHETAAHIDQLLSRT